MQKHFPIFVLFFLLFVFSAKAQYITVTGVVTSADDAKTMPFVSISVKGTTQAVTTDIDGKYAIQNVSAADTLLFSFVGYTTQFIKVGSQQVINIKLTTSTKELGEVVVTALGINRQKRELGYSTAKISGSEIEQSNSPNILNALTGKAAGVQITNPDGVDGGTTRITIRGNNNVSGNNQPLIVVDGIPIDNDPGLTDIGRGRDWGSAINNINMPDIEDYSLIPGGAGSAKYGARGANGVILITTKKGKKQKGIGVNYNMTYKITTPYRYRDVQNKYGGGAPNADLTSPAFQMGADSIPTLPNLITDAEFGYPGSAVSWGPIMEGQLIRWWDDSIRPWSPQPDNLKIPFQDGKNIMHSVSVEGGGDVGSMRFSFTRINNTPIVHNSNYNQTTASTTSTMNVTDKINLGLSVSYSLYHRLNSPMLGEDASSFNKALLYSLPRSYRAEDLNNYMLANGTQNSLTGFPYLYIDKYLWWNYYNNNTTLDRSKLNGALSLNYAITKWLTLTGRTGVDYTNDEFQTKNKPTDLIGLQNGYYSQAFIHNKSINSDFLFTATKEKIFHSNFNLSYSAGASTWHRKQDGLSAHSGTWYYPNWYSLSNFTSTTYGQDSSGNVIVTNKGDDLASLLPANSFYEKKINSVYSFLNLSFRDYLFIELTGRNDWSSALPSNANSYFYPGISVSYIVSEAFNFKKDWLSYCKVRGGAAQTATDTDPYLTEFYYKTSLFGGQQSSTFPDTIPPIALKPQRVNSFEIGTNLGFFNDKITLDLTYYYKYCFDQIIPNLPVPASSGASYVGINEGVITNKGFEVILNATVLQKKNFIFKTGLNYTRNRNTIVSLGENVNTYILADIWGENGPQMALHEGDDFGSIVGWDYIYINGERVVNEDGTKYLYTKTRVPIGNASPDFLAGWTTQFKYKNFTLNTLIDTKWGGDIYSGSYVTGLQTGQSPETLLERDGGGLVYTDPAGNTSNIGVILPGVHEDGTPNSTVVHYYYKYMPNAGGWGNFVSKPGIVEDTWIKFREINLSYSLPQNLVRKLKIFQELSVSVTGRDLFYIYTTVPDHVNPEGTLGAGNAQGFEWASLPGVRSFTFGINARF